MNFKKLIPYAKAEMQKMTDDEFKDAAQFILAEINAEEERRGLNK